MSQSHGYTGSLVFSVEQGGMPDTFNVGCTAMARIILEEQGVDYTLINGVYNGSKETSFLVRDTEHNRKVVDVLAHTYDQECVMVLHPHIHGMYKAYFAYRDRKEFMGYLRSATKEVAEAQGDYSYRPDIDTYFIISDSDDTRMAA